MPRVRGAPVVIKRYSNRRLYDTEDSRYITLEDLAEKIRRGTDVTVSDAKTGHDLTQSTLAQVILESRGAAGMLPVPLLTQLIRMGDDALSEFMGRTMSWALEIYLGARHGAQALTPYNPFATLPFSATSALARMFSRGNGGAAQGPASVPWEEPEAAPPPADANDVASLRREIEELKEAIRGKKRR
jgi:polyhydroxyalkanoate synthesis repressor PhaR